MVILKSVEQAIEGKKQDIGCDEIHECDLYLQEMELCSLQYVFIFGCNEPLNNDCKIRTIWYQDHLWKSRVRMYGNCYIDNNFLKMNNAIVK